MLIHVRIGSDVHGLTWEEFEVRVRNGRVPEDAELRFEPVTGDAWVRAGDLELYRSLRDDDAIAWRSRFRRSPAPIATALLVGVQVRLWWAAQLPDVADWMVDHLTNWTPPTFEDGEIWRPLTMGIVHTAPFHLILNMLWLAYTGWNVERALGRANLVTLFFASVLGGSLASMAGSPGTPSLGASGGVFGLIAASVVFGLTRPELLPARGRRLFGMAMLPYLVLMFGSGLMNEGTDNWSHLGGLLTGGALALILDPDALQRRPRWNLRIQLGVAGATAVLLLILAVAGPRLLPLQDSRDLLAGSAELEGWQAVEYAVPAGWRRGTTTSRELGWATPRSQRAWAAEELSSDAPLDVGALAEAWGDDLLRDWPEATIGDAEPAITAGVPGLRRTAEVDGRILEWRASVRGLRAVQTVWECEAASFRHTTPLRDRLQARVVWNEPVDLVRARAAVARNAGSLRKRMDLARALSDHGEAEDALALWGELLAEHPRDDRVLLGLLRTHGCYPAAAPHRRATWAEILADDPTPPVVVAIAELLRADEPVAADGLLQLAWWRWPGDRDVRRELRRHRLPARIEGTVPWELAVDPRTRRPRAAPAEAPPLSLDAAAPVGQAWHAVRDAWANDARALLDARDPAALELLLLLRNGAPPTDPEDAVPRLVGELERGGAEWLDLPPTDARWLLETAGGPQPSAPPLP